jgi:hypothetical protein
MSRENRRPVVSHWQTLSHNVVSLESKLGMCKWSSLFPIIYLYNPDENYISKVSNKR